MKKQKSRSKLVKELDAVYSKYIRLSKITNLTNNVCVCCGVEAHWKKMQNGHYCSRSHYNTRWMDMNCKPVCLSCNVFKNGNYPEYTKYMLFVYGQEALVDLINESHKIVKIQNYEIEEQIDKYKKIVVSHIAMLILVVAKQNILFCSIISLLVKNE